MTRPAAPAVHDHGGRSPFPVAASWPEHGGELVQSLTYRESYAPPTAAGSLGISDPPARRLLSDAPWLLRAAAGGAWALVSVIAAGSVLVVLVLVLVRAVGWLT